MNSMKLLNQFWISLMATLSSCSIQVVGENQDSCKQKAKTSEVDPDFDGQY